MKSKNSLLILSPLFKTPYFTSNEASQLGVNASVLAYYVKVGALERIERGVYRSVDAPPIKDFRWEDLVYAMARVKDGVICQVTALAIYGLTDEIPRQHWIAIHHNTRHRADSSVKIIRTRDITLGRTKINIEGIALSIFDRERTIVEAFKYLGNEAAIKALKLAVEKKGNEKIDLAKIRNYAIMLRVNIHPYILMVTT